MKKLLILGSFVAATLLTACDNDNDRNDAGPCPVTDIEMPQSSAQNPIEPGSEIVIHGNGFVADCEIWLVPASKEVAAIQAEILQVTDSEVRFLAPLVTGPQTVELRQNGGAWNIGSLTFTEETKPSGILPKRISHIKITYPDDLTFVNRYAYDEQGRIISITRTEQQSVIPGQTFTDEETTISYETDRIIFTEPSGAQSILALTDGRTTEISGIPDEQESEYPDNYAFTYNADGYIATSFWTENPEQKLSAKSIYTIENGLLTQVRTIGDSEESDSETRTYTYDPEQPNNLNIDLYGLNDFNSATDLDRIYLVGAGGTRLQSLPTRIESSEDGTETYRYTMEGEYISKIEIDEEGEPVTILEFFYEE